MLKLRRPRRVRIGTIYKTSGNPSGNEWFWGLNGVQNGPGPFNGFVPTLNDAKAAFSEAWRGRLEANNVFLRETLRTIRLRHLADCVCRTATAAPSASVLNRGAQCSFHCDFGPSWPLNGMERNAPFFVKTLSDEWNRNTRQFVP
jgi:hypothetical protein